MNDEQEPVLFPAWRQAEVDLLAQGTTYGSIVTDEWLEKAFGLKPATNIQQFERNKLVMLRQFSALRESLLENHKMMLRPVRGVGYTVVPSHLQTTVAQQDRAKEVKTALRKMAAELSNVNVAALSESQRKENADALAKLGSMSVMFRKALKGPPK